MENTIRQWLSELEEPYRTQALVLTPMRNMKKTASSKIDALHSAFIWGDTPQKHRYWKKLAIKLQQT